MKTKQALAAAVMTVLIAASAAACSPSSEHDSKDSGRQPDAGDISSTASGEPAGQPEYAPNPEERYKISMVTSLFGPVDEDGFMLKHWEETFNVDLDMWYIDSSKFDEVFNLKLASDEIPDVIQTRSINAFNNYYEQLVLAEIPTEIIDAYMPSLKQKIEAESPGVFKLGVIDGRQYGIPSEIRLHNKYRSPTIFRGDWLDAVGIAKVPETLAEFEEAFYKFTREDPDGNGQDDTYGLSSSGFASILGAFGYVPDLLGGGMNWASKDGALVYTSVQPEVKSALTLLRTWYQDGVIDPEFITGENKGGYWAISHAFVEGRIGYTGHGAYYHWCSPETFAAAQDYIELQKINPAAADKLVFSQPPVGDGGSCMTSGSNVFTGSMVTFGSHMENELPKMAKVLEIQEYIAGGTPERYAEFYYGKKGEMWEYDSDGVPQPIGIYVDPKEMAKVGAHYGLVMFSTMEGHGLLNKKGVQWAEKNGFDLNGKSNELFITLPSESLYKTELKKMENEMAIDIITGAKPADYFDEFVAQWKAMGGETLEKEANDWYAASK